MGNRYKISPSSVTSNVASNSTAYCSNAFFASGTQSVIYSLWNISDVSTKRILSDMYGRLAQSKNVVSSLNAAKRAFLDNAEPLYRHPYYWAGLVISTNTIDDSKNGKGNILLILATLFLIAILLINLKK